MENAKKIKGYEIALEMEHVEDQIPNMRNLLNKDNEIVLNSLSCTEHKESNVKEFLFFKKSSDGWQMILLRLSSIDFVISEYLPEPPSLAIQCLEFFASQQLFKKSKKSRKFILVPF